MAFGLWVLYVFLAVVRFKFLVHKVSFGVGVHRDVEHMGIGRY